VGNDFAEFVDFHLQLGGEVVEFETEESVVGVLEAGVVDEGEDVVERVGLEGVVGGLGEGVAQSLDHEFVAFVGLALDGLMVVDAAEDAGGLLELFFEFFVHVV